MDRGVKACGVKRIRIHDLRHSHVSLLINMGFSVLAIGNRFGHESEKITYRYAHLFPSVQDEKLWTKNGRRASMSAKNKDDKNRWRNKNVGFRCSPEEGIEIDKRWKMCGFCTKQDYILECLLHPYLIARGNPMMLISIRKELKEISVELSRIDDASEIDEELFTPIRTMLEILESFKNDEGNNREDIKMSRVIICANQKGGVAKTTSVVNIGIGLSRLGKKVLVIDNDPQGSLTEALGYPEPDKLEITLATIMEWRHLLSVL